MAPKLRISVDLDLCVGNAMCETFAPKVFVLNDDRQSQVADAEADTVEEVAASEEDEPSVEPVDVPEEAAAVEPPDELEPVVSFRDVAEAASAGRFFFDGTSPRSK